MQSLRSFRPSLREVRPSPLLAQSSVRRQQLLFRPTSSTPSGTTLRPKKSPKILVDDLVLSLRSVRTAEGNESSVAQSHCCAVFALSKILVAFAQSLREVRPSLRSFRPSLREVRPSPLLAQSSVRRQQLLFRPTSSTPSGTTLRPKKSPKILVDDLVLSLRSVRTAEGNESSVAQSHCCAVFALSKILVAFAQSLRSFRPSLRSFRPCCREVRPSLRSFRPSPLLSHSSVRRQQLLQFRPTCSAPSGTTLRTKEKSRSGRRTRNGRLPSRKQGKEEEEGG